MLRRALMVFFTAVVVYSASPSQAEMISSAKPDEVTGHPGRSTARGCGPDLAPRA